MRQQAARQLELPLAADERRTGRFLYAVNQAAATRGSISVYDISAGHRLVKTIETVRDVDDVKGVAASMVTGRLYVSYRTRSGVGMIYCLNVYDDAVLWNWAIDPDIERLAIYPAGGLGLRDFLHFYVRRRETLIRQKISKT